MYKSNVAYAQKGILYKNVQEWTEWIPLQATSLMKATNNTEQKEVHTKSCMFHGSICMKFKNRVRSQVVNSQDGSWHLGEQ